MELATLQRLRRALSAAVAVSAIALVMAKVQVADGGGQPSGLLASFAFALCSVAFVVVWRKEHAANEAAFAERERAQLAGLALQLELAKKKKEQTRADVP